MTIPISSLADRALVGNDAGWMLAFHAEENGKLVERPLLEIGSDDYYAEIEASLSGGLEGGVYDIRVESLIDEHYAQIKKAKAARLFLYWRDTNSSVTGYLRNLAGLTDAASGIRSFALEDFLVAELAVRSVTRRTGSRRYEVEISVRERIYDRLLTTRNPTAIVDKESDPALRALFAALGVSTD